MFADDMFFPSWCYYGPSRPDPLPCVVVSLLIAWPARPPNTTSIRNHDLMNENYPASKLAARNFTVGAQSLAHLTVPTVLDEAHFLLIRSSFRPDVIMGPPSLPFASRSGVTTHCLARPGAQLHTTTGARFHQQKEATTPA